MTAPFLRRLAERWRWSRPADAPAPTLTIDMTAEMLRDYRSEFPVASDSVARVLTAIRGQDLTALSRRSPSLAGYDWTTYLRCSVVRSVRFQRALHEHTPAGGRVLDYGSYFGNVSLALTASGFRTDAADAYSVYGAALSPCVQLLRDANIEVLDFAVAGHDLRTRSGYYDAVVCAGVVEHIPHTPRPMLEALTSVLKPGGILVLETPNLAYLYRRLALLEGQSIFPPIAQQFYTELPFEGHHREYTMPEVQWMLSAVGHQVLSIGTFNFSVFGQSQLTGDDVQYYHAMQADPTLREIILAISRRPNHE